MPKDSAAYINLRKLAAAQRKVRFELLFDQQCRGVGLPRAEPEWGFHPTRQWRFDRAWPAFKVAVEIDGGVFSKGRHTRGLGYEEDCVKMAEALLLGWSVYRFSTGQIKKGVAIAFLERDLLPRYRKVVALRAL